MMSHYSDAGIIHHKNCSSPYHLGLAATDNRNIYFSNRYFCVRMIYDLTTFREIRVIRCLFHHLPAIDDVRAARQRLVVAVELHAVQRVYSLLNGAQRLSMNVCIHLFDGCRYGQVV